MTGKCDGLLAVSEHLLKKQIRNATENWTTHAVEENKKERRGRDEALVSLVFWRIDGVTSSSANAPRLQLSSMSCHHTSSGRVGWNGLSVGGGGKRGLR